MLDHELLESTKTILLTLFIFLAGFVIMHFLINSETVSRFLRKIPYKIMNSFLGRSLVLFVLFAALLVGFAYFFDTFVKP